MAHSRFFVKTLRKSDMIIISSAEQDKTNKNMLVIIDEYSPPPLSLLFNVVIRKR